MVAGVRNHASNKIAPLLICDCKPAFGQAINAGVHDACRGRVDGCAVTVHGDASVYAVRRPDLRARGHAVQ